MAIHVTAMRPDCVRLAGPDVIQLARCNSIRRGLSVDPSRPKARCICESVKPDNPLALMASRTLSLIVPDFGSAASAALRLVNLLIADRPL